MAVYTSVDRAELDAFMKPYGLGEISDYQGIEGGIENTNYFVNTLDDGVERHFVLTLFEELGIEELPYFVRLTRHLEGSGIPVPAPYKDTEGKTMKQLCDRGALLLPRFEGVQLDEPELDHCAQLGEMLGKMHRKARYFPLMRQPHRGMSWWSRESQTVAPHLSEEDAALLAQEVALYDSLRECKLKLPQGTIHGDLFIDNALFVDDKLNGIIDLYNACTGYLLYDLAIAVNDWCVQADGELDPERLAVLLNAYAKERPFEEDEYKAWPVMLRTAAMRFWLSRLITFHNLDAGHYEGSRVVKDPEPFRQILLAHIAVPLSLPSLITG